MGKTLERDVRKLIDPSPSTTSPLDKQKSRSTSSPRGGTMTQQEYRTLKLFATAKKHGNSQTQPPSVSQPRQHRPQAKQQQRPRRRVVRDDHFNNAAAAAA